MTTTRPRVPAAASRPPLLTRPLLLRFVSMVGASASFFLLLSVVPRYATESGAGLATGALMLSTVLGELAAPRLVARYGYRVALIAGLTLLGAPALVLTVSDGMAWIVTVCLVRGLGFALTLVAGGALTASLIPAERRGEEPRAGGRGLRSAVADRAAARCVARRARRVRAGRRGRGRGGAGRDRRGTGPAGPGADVRKPVGCWPGCAPVV
ncbi:hypothetical protein O1M63_36150 [Streptomyces mirabilis]|nr:hypothetical protein [Streptomyces mirabilis]